MLTDTKQLKGSLLIFISSILFGSYGIWSVLAGKDFGVFFQGYVRAVMVLLFLVPLCIYFKSWVKIEKKDYKPFALFSLFVVFTQAPLYYAFQNSGVGIASLVFFATYLITQYVFGGLFLGELLSQTMTKNCTRLQTSYNCSELNTKNTQKQTTTIKPLWHKYYL